MTAEKALNIQTAILKETSGLVAIKAGEVLFYAGSHNYSTHPSKSAIQPSRLVCCTEKSAVYQMRLEIKGIPNELRNLLINELH